MSSNSASMTQAEVTGCSNSIAQEASSLLTVGPLQTLGVGCATVLSMSLYEGWLFLRPLHQCPTDVTQSDRYRFLFRYSLSQLIPSISRMHQDPAVIVSAFHMPSSMVWASLPNLPPRRQHTVTNLRAVRGAIAATIVFAQVVSFVNVTGKAKENYMERIKMGRAPPIMNDPHRRGVVIRLAGTYSDVTALGLAREGRFHLFPVFEDNQAPSVSFLAQRYGIIGRLGVPVFWQVHSGRYAHPHSWKGMRIPNEWLFDINKKSSSSSTKNDKLLVLEADATCDNPDSLGLAGNQNASDLDVDLYEVAQGFYQLRQLAASNAPSHDVLRVLLVDSEAVVTSGNKRKSSARKYVEELGLADIIIDTKSPIVYSLTRWLYTKTGKRLENESILLSVLFKPLTLFKAYVKDRIVLLETPQPKQFEAMKTLLNEFGFIVMDRSEAMSLFGSINDFPLIVYEKNSQDTVHTIQRLISQGIVMKENVCAMCPTSVGLVDLKDGQEPQFFTLCCSDLYDRIFKWVRSSAINGRSKQDIQSQLDNDIGSILQEQSKTNGPIGVPST